MPSFSTQLSTLMTVSTLLTGSFTSNDADAAAYVKHRFGVSPVEVTDPLWSTDRRGVTDPLWSEVDRSATDFVVIVPSEIDLPRSASIVLHDEADVTVFELDVDSAGELFDQIDQMMDTRSRRASDRSSTYRSVDRGLDTGFVTVIQSDAVYEQALDSTGRSLWSRIDGVMILNPDSMYPSTERTSSNPTPHP